MVNLGLSDVLQDIPMEMLLTVENMVLELDQGIRCRSQCVVSCQESDCREESPE